MRPSLGCHRTIMSGLLVLALVPALSALPSKVFVTPKGKDTATCGNIGTPCKTLAVAIGRVSASGSIIIVDSGEFGSVTVTKAVTIEAALGVQALIQPGGVTVTAGSSDTVVLRGLAMDQGGILINSAGTVHVEKCTITNSSGDGIVMASSGRLSVSDSTLRSNNVGIRTYLFSGLASITIDRCVIAQNGGGISMGDYSISTVRGSLVTGNINGIGVNTEFGGTADMTVTDCLVTDQSAIGVFSDSSNGAATLRISDSTVINNQIGLFQSAPSGTSELFSRGNNTVEKNFQGDTLGTIGTYSPK